MACIIKEKYFCLIISSIFITLFIATLTGCAKTDPVDEPEEILIESDYQVGQKWRYKNRLGESESTFTVVRVEKHPYYNYLIHISVDGLKIENPIKEGEFVTSIPHMAFTERAIKYSVLTLVDAETEIDEDTFYSAYNIWREDYQQGKQGVYEDPLSVSISKWERIIKKKFNDK